MPNSLLTINMITRKALQLFRNQNAFLIMIDKQYDPQYAQTGAKIGDTLRIRLPNDYVVRTSATAVPQNTTERSTPLTISEYYGVDTSFSSVDLALSMDDFATRVLEPMVNVLAGAVASKIMLGVENVPNFVHKVSGAATVAPDAATFLQAGAVLTQNCCPANNRNIIIDPLTMSRVVSSLTGLFNPQNKISSQYTSGLISQNVLGFDWAVDNTVLLHTEGAFTTGTMNGANQTGSTLTVTSTGATLAVGDIITIAGVHQVNRVTKKSTGNLQQFVITVAAPATSTSLSVYPPLNPQIAGQDVAYQTVDASPTVNAAITTPVAASEIYRKNFAFHPTACTMASADLELPTGAVVAASRAAYDGISIRMTRDWNSTTDQWLSRLDFIFGSTWPRPEWAVIIADAV
jgi:hypothetical protein